MAAPINKVKSTVLSSFSVQAHLTKCIFQIECQKIESQLVIARNSSLTCSIREKKKFFSYREKLEHDMLNSSFWKNSFCPKITYFALLKLKLPNMTDWHTLNAKQNVA